MDASRRSFLTRSSMLAVAATVDWLATSSRAFAEGSEDLAAVPPEGFVPLTRPGVVVRAKSRAPVASLMQANQLWPRPEPARALLEAALAELSGESDLTRALRRFVHPADRVAVKVNGIAGPGMSTNYELIQPLVQAILDAGVPPDQVVVYEQYMNFLSGTRVGLKAWRLPDGVVSHVHNNAQATMKPLAVYEHVPTRYVQFLTDATAVISISLLKDHSICGYTGGLKNMTHGSIINPQDHHRHRADPQIALLYAHPIMRSRVRLHITDGFKMIYDEGPLDKNPRRRILHGAVHAATDPVALDSIGAELVDQARIANGLPTLERVGRAPSYLRSAAGLGLGIAERAQIRLRELVV
jgi:uncharacterized protein (DUF362 family)